MTTSAQALDLPFEEAIAFFRQKANVTSTHWTDVWQKANARAFTVAGAASQALVEDFRREVAKALEQGTTLQEFRKSFDDIVRKHGWEHTGSPGWRSRIIYETNLSMAYAAGRYEQMTQPATLAAFPYWQYVHSGAQHPRRQHLAWNGLTLRATDPFWQTHYPPNGWHCGCRVRPLTSKGLARQGKSDPDPSPVIETLPWANPKTGEVKEVPVGIDPGFDYNPGQAWKETPAPAEGKAKPKTKAAPKPAPIDPSPAPAPLPELVAKTRKDVDRIDGILTKAFKGWAEALTPEERKALRLYKSSGYREMNRHLRGLGPAPEWQDLIKALDEALTRATIPRPLRVFRGITAGDPLIQAEVGTVVADSGFLSTTINPATSLGFADQVKGAHIEIRVPIGYRGAAYVHPYPDYHHMEFEVLFRPKTRFKVVERSETSIVLEPVE